MVRGFGGPQMYFAIERLLHKVAVTLGKDPLEVRKANFYGTADRNVTPYHQTVEDNIIHRVVEELEHAKARGARIYCELVGGGATADAHHITAPHPEGLGARNVMLAALDDAGMKPEEIDYINTHGTSTPIGDGAEVKAIKAVFGDHAYDLNISATKSMTGHCLGAAGVIEAIACIKSVMHDIVPPTINHFTDDPELDQKLNFTFNKAQQRTVNAALSNTFGFGGHNACVIVKKYTA